MGTTAGTKGMIAVALACAVLAGCGQDPPEAPGVVPGVLSGPVENDALHPPVVLAATGPGIAPAPAESLARVQANGPAKCNIETIGRKGFDGALPRVARSGAVPVVGWHASVGKLLLVVHDEDQANRWSVEIPARTERPDVSAALGAGAPAATGFAFDLDLNVLAPGYYGIYLLDAASGQACAYGRKFMLGQP